MWLLAAAITTVFMAYTLAMFGASRRPGGPVAEAPGDLFFVFVIPALDEAAVIAGTIDRLLAIPGDNVAVLVVDDGSSDATAQVVRQRTSDRVWLLERHPPRARQGKGAALNHAVAHLRSSGLLVPHPADKVIIGIVDADGRLEPGALRAVAPHFADPSTGAVQVGVRMENVDAGFLARMQDFEFVTYTEIFQRARQRLGSSGLGGNGQFTRLQALCSLGEQPWSDSLTEDLDLGIRLLAAGWHNAYAPETWVDQEAVVSLRRLVRQRGRWFQGHLQCWRRLGTVLRSDIPARATIDIVHILISPVLVLVMSLSLVGFFATIVAGALVAPGSMATSLVRTDGLFVALAYLLSFGLASPYAYAYWRRRPQVGPLRSLLWGHLFAFYNYVWFVAGWLAVGRLALRRRGWQKTARGAGGAPGVPRPSSATALTTATPGPPALCSGGDPSGPFDPLWTLAAGAPRCP